MDGERSAPDHPLFARLYDPLTAPAEWLLAPRRRRLATGLSGRILDVGSGTGATLPYLATLADGEIVGVEPDPSMRRRVAVVAARFGNVDLVGARAEQLPFVDDSFDAAVAALVFCTIGDPEQATDELARVVRPGGEVRLFEHVRGEGVYGRLQDAGTPLWRRAAGGCHLNRDTVARFETDERFETVGRERVGPNVPPVAPFVYARLRRR